MQPLYNLFKQSANFYKSKAMESKQLWCSTGFWTQVIPLLSVLRNSMHILHYWQHTLLMYETWVGGKLFKQNPACMQKKAFFSVKSDY